MFFESRIKNNFFTFEIVIKFEFIYSFSDSKSEITYVELCYSSIKNYVLLIILIVNFYSLYSIYMITFLFILYFTD